MAPFKYGQRGERMSIRVPLSVKNHIWSQARREHKSATDVVVDLLVAAFADKPPAPKWRPGTTKGAKRSNDKRQGKQQPSDIFA